MRALFCTALIVAVGCSGQHTNQISRPAPFVATSIARVGSIGPAEQLAGIVTPYQNVAIQSMLTEPADEVDVQEGEHVRSGQILTRLNTADLQASLQSDLATAQSDRAGTTHTVFQGSLSIEQGVEALRSAQSSLRQAQANLTRDSTDLTRDRKLVAEGYISQQQVDQQIALVQDDEQALKSAVAGLASAQANVQANGTLTSNGLQTTSVQQAQATERVALAQAQQVRVQIAKATIVSPIDGIVVNRNLNPGEYPGTRQLFTLQQVDPIYVILHASGEQIAPLRNGANVIVVSSDLRRKHFPGTIVGVLNQIAPGSTDFQVKVLLRNPNGELRPGMAVSAEIALPVIHGVRVPVTAFIDDNHNALMSVDDTSTVKTLAVTEVGDDGKTAVVTGLASGQRVVNNGQVAVGDGEKVSVR
ncbi:MAG TPA: efflux RND transporter periplasmic adaptor subunit [Candidatus Baltobacteraceae bacterium]|jgi:multidrug efflux pump subunit AcrA (membrane-fusion protein)|nr:efflux RND transporter periplasmic adaptor subunit [Candidatus Baltobacteraceae bacterium]